MNYKLFLYGFYLSIVPLFGQNNNINANLYSNTVYYFDDKRTGDFLEMNRFRSNSYLNLNYTTNPFSFQIQFEGYAPQPILNYNPNFNQDINAATYSINFEKDKIKIALGYFYNQFGSGLLFRAYENRELGINNAMFGAFTQVQLSHFIQTKAFYGKQRDGFKLASGYLLGSYTTINFKKLLSLKSTYLNYSFGVVGRHQNLNRTNTNFNLTTWAFSNSIAVAKKDSYLNLEYVFKNKDALVENKTFFDNRLFPGNAVLLNSGFSIKGVSINATFRRLENFEFYSNRLQRRNPYNNLWVNYIPSLTKQQDFSLANIYVYQSQPQLSFNPVGKSGEIGYQIDAFYNFKKGSKLGGKYGTKLAINYAHWNGLNAQYDLANRTYSSKFLKFGPKYYSDFNIELRKKFTEKLTTLNTIMWQFYNKKWLEDSQGQIKTFLILNETSYKLNKKTKVKLKIEHLFAKSDKRNWFAVTPEVYFNNFSVFLSDLYNYGNLNKVEKIHYYTFGTSYSKNKLRLQIAYGRQRGGLICVGGICRLVPRTTGLTAQINAHF
ncbi:MAG: DUF6029 family protein [Lutibacter sp.]